MAQVKACPDCERRNAADNTVCQFCGMTLEQAPIFDAPDLALPKITINDRVLKLPLQVELVIGRADAPSGWMPDVDLLPLGGTAGAGVSRRHARLVWYGHWQIQDLGSANGTFVDRHRLAPDMPQDLKPGAVIQIGRLYLVYHG